MSSYVHAMSSSPCLVAMLLIAFWLRLLQVFAVNKAWASAKPAGSPYTILGIPCPTSCCSTNMGKRFGYCCWKEGLGYLISCRCDGAVQADSTMRSKWNGGSCARIFHGEWGWPRITPVCGREGESATSRKRYEQAAERAWWLAFEG
jgi:hypothetical protein